VGLGRHRNVSYQSRRYARCRTADTKRTKIDPLGSGQEIEQLSVRARLAKPLVRHDVGRDVECCLNRDLQRVFDEPPLAQVMREFGRTRQSMEIGDIRLDERELFGEE
jgi:hypothetical protein